MATPIEPGQNPLATGLPRALRPQPCVMVIFGAAGDLAWRKRLPALDNLNVDGLLPANFATVGFGLGGTRGPGRMGVGPGPRRHPRSLLR